MLIMTDGEDNSSQKKLKWIEEWFQKSGLKSTFFTICDGHNQKNQYLAQIMHSKYITSSEKWFENGFDAASVRAGFMNLK